MARAGRVPTGTARAGLAAIGTAPAGQVRTGTVPAGRAQTGTRAPKPTTRFQAEPATVRYWTLNSPRSSVQTCSTRQPARAASAANSAGLYLYDASVQMLSPRSK